MFYSHQLLARKAPLGEIWRAATLHAKINRRNLNKLNIINICEEILNPSVPMALRLSGILMGGVVIVYERKVKLLYEDVTRLLVEINEAWKVKPRRDPTILPKGKSQAKYEDVTLPDNQPTDLGEFEQLLQFSNSDTLLGIDKNAYTEMNLDKIDDSYINHNQEGVDLPHNHHQADIEDITLSNRFDSHQADAGHFNQFERFEIEGDDIEGDEYTQHKFPSDNQNDLTNTLVPSPPPQDIPQNPDEIQEQHPGEHINHQSDEDKVQHSPQMPRPGRRRGKKPRAPLMDHEHTIIPGQMYQSWLQETSDIVSRRGRKRKHLGSMGSVKMARLMDLPPISLVCGLLNESMDIYYPFPLLQQWMKMTQPLHDSPSGEISPGHPPAPSSSSPPPPPPPPPDMNDYHDPTAFPFEDHYSGVGSGSLEIEMPRPHINTHVTPTENLRKELKTNIINSGVSIPDWTGTPGNSGDEVKSIASSDSGLNANTGRTNMKRPVSSSIRSGGSLKPVEEERSWDPDLNFNLAQLSENALENALLVETGPTQTQKVPLPDQPTDQLTDSIRIQLKTYFDTPGSAQTESLNQLAFGLDRKKAACLFYQTCVLASRDFIKVEQKEPYGNILISRGKKM